MHDVFMHDSVAHSYQIRHDRPGYLAMMQSLYGPRGRRDAALYWDGALRMPQIGRRYTCAPYILDTSLGAIVHSRMAARTLRRELDLPVAELPLPYPARRDPAPHTGPPPWRLIVFGYLGSNRCLDQTLTALANACEPRQFHLHIYGDLEDRAPLFALIERLGLQDLVTVHGFVPEVELDRELATAHLAINLRFPTKGEASYSQLRIWSHALPSLVSRIGWYAELPEDAVVFVRPGALVEDLTEHLNQYAAAPERYIATGMTGHRYFVENHSTEKYAAAIMEMARHAGDYRGRWCASLLADRAAEALAGWFDPSTLPEYAEHVGQAITGS
jgi:glycosyltransferase involved in cell wall biosynthesis